MRKGFITMNRGNAAMNQRNTTMNQSNTTMNQRNTTMKMSFIPMILTILLLLCIFPATASASGEGRVHVVVENTTFTPETADSLGATWKEDFWHGTLVDEWIPIDESSTMMTIVMKALEKNHLTQSGAESNYIETVHGLSASDGGPMSGWVGTLNDWFCNEGADAYTVTSGKLEAGDEIRILYTSNGYGADLGGVWGNLDTTLQSMEFSEGTLSPVFDGNTDQYILSVPEGTKSVMITPAATNKYFQVRTRIGNQVYKRTEEVPIAHNTIIMVECNWEGSLSMNEGADSHTYIITVEDEAVKAKIADVENKISSIGEVNLDSNKALAKADKAYKKLSAEEQEAVSNLASLQEAWKAYYALLEQNKKDVLSETERIITEKVSTPGVSSNGGEWAVLALARNNAKVGDSYYDTYYKAVEQYVEEHIQEGERLHKVKSTENSRVIITLASIGKDPQNVKDHNLLLAISDMDYLKKQGMNGPVWALLAFDSAAYEIPTAEEGKEQVTRENLIDAILEKELKNGGWALSGNNADPDTTGMVLQALAPYYKTDEKVRTAVDRALTVLSAIQSEDGGFASWGTATSESCAQLITAFSALGIDADADIRFVKNDRSVYDALLTFYEKNGGFRHTFDGSVNQMATEQAFIALVSYQRLQSGQTGFFNMSDVVKETEKKNTKEDTEENNKKEGNANGQNTGEQTKGNDGSTQEKSPLTVDDSDTAEKVTLFLASILMFFILLYRKRNLKNEKTQ